MVVQAHLKSGGGELTRENVRLMGGAVAALRREQSAAAEEEAAAAAEAATAAAAAAEEEVTKEAVEKAAALVARISVLDGQSVRLTTHLPARVLRAEIDISHPEQPGGINLDREQPEIGITHPEQPGLGQAWLLALGDFNLDPAQVLDEVCAVELLPAYLYSYRLPTLPDHFYYFIRCARRGYTASAAASAGRCGHPRVCMWMRACACVCACACMRKHAHACTCVPRRPPPTCGASAATATSGATGTRTMGCSTGRRAAGARTRWRVRWAMLWAAERTA